MKFFGFENDEDDYEENDNYTEDRRKKSRSPRSSGAAPAGKLIVYNYNSATLNNDKIHLREEFINNGAMILVDLHDLSQREYDEEGNVVSEGMYKDDRQQGIWKITVGDLVSEGNYEYGEKFGVWKSSYLNGHKAFKGEYFSGKPNGKHYYYYQNGQVEHNEQWKHGKAVKTWNYYNENGNLKYSVYYKDGQENRIVAPSK